MKAIRIHGYGGPEVLRLEDIPQPSPCPGELLVKVHAASVNPVDWNVRQGHMQQFLPLKLPAVLGWDLQFRRRHPRLGAYDRKGDSPG